MNAQSQTRTSGEEEQSNRAASKGPSVTSRESAPRKQSSLWAEQSNLWGGNGFGRIAAAMTIPSIDACLSLFNDYRDFAISAADQLEEDAKVLKDGWRELGQCEGPEDYAKTGAALREALNKQCTKSGQKLASLAGAYATRRIRASAALASSVIDQAKPS